MIVKPLQLVKLQMLHDHEGTAGQNVRVGQAEVVRAVHQLDGALRDLGRPQRADHEAAYLKSQLVHYGTSVPDTRVAVRQLLKTHGPGHDEVMELAKRLWDEPPKAVHERRLAAALLLAHRPGQVGLSDVPQVERMIRESRTWALVDVLSGDVLGPAFDQLDDQEEVTRVLDRWAGDADFWVRRSALLTHLRPLRAGRGDWDRFTRYAGAMLAEREFFIRKAIGWVLRDMSRQRPDLVFEWVNPRAREASGVTIREAVKYLRPAQREQILAARQ